MSAPAVGRASEAREALLPVYAPPADVVLVRGQGPWVDDRDGRRYLDFTSGIAVTALGHGHPAVSEAIAAWLGTGLVHTSNLYRTEPAERFATELIEVTFPGRAFFCNSGAEACEAAFKFARRWAGALGGPEKHEIVAFRGSFHGRLFGSLAATDRPDYREPFEPLMPGVRFADLDDLGSVAALVSAERTAAVIVEPVQGEGGVRPVPDAVLRTLRDVCTGARAALVFDEIQCGYGRTGDLFAFERSGVLPDLLTLAKPLAGGLPMGAVVAAPAIAEAVRPGDHATTFGGGPLVASVARAVLATLRAPGFLEAVRARASELKARLEELAASRPRIHSVRGRGLMWGIVLDGPAAPVVEAARAAGLLVCSAGPQVVRLLPPLTIDPESLSEGLGRLERALRA